MKYGSLVVIIMMIISFSTLSGQGVGLNSGGVQVHGFVSQGYLKSTDNNFLGETKDGTFEFNEFGINFSTELTDELHVGLQLFARDLGYLGNEQILIDWAYGDYRVEDWFGIRAGKMKMPLGLYNEIRDVDMLRTNILMPQGVYNESWRETFNAIKGIGIYGTIGAGAAGSFSYQGQVGVLNVGPGTGMNKYIEDQLFADMYDYTLSTAYVANLSWETPLSGLRISGSAFMTDISTSGITEDSDLWRSQTVNAAREAARMIGLPENTWPTTYEEALGFSQGIGVNLDLVGLSITQDLEDSKAYWISGEYLYDDLKLAAEYFLLTTKATASNPDLGVLRSFDNELGGFYGSIDYRFTGWLEAGSYYSEYYIDLSDKEGKGYAQVYDLPSSNSYLKDMALSLRFDVNQHWTVKAEGHKMNGTAVMFREDQEDPKKVKEDWYLFAAKLTFNF